MAYTDIDKPGEYFNTVLYTGNDSTNAITGVGFQPDWVWIKDRDNVRNHVLNDAVRGATKNLFSNTTGAEATDTSTLTAFNSDGFTLGNGVKVNGNNINFVSWNWLGANGTASNTAGSINSTVSANTTSGFSIVSWTGSGADATIGHGLTQAPTIFIVKNRTDSGTNWRVGQVLTSSNNMTDGNGYYMELDDTKASTNPGSAVTWGSTPTAPTSSVFTVGSNNSNNGSSDAMIAYCFHSVNGYSKMGSYTGNGNADGTFVYTGFKPAFVMIKQTNSTRNWIMLDNKINTDNPYNTELSPNLSEAEATNIRFDSLSNGFKLRLGSGASNASGGSYIYMAFAENPFVSSTGVPACAR